MPTTVNTFSADETKVRFKEPFLTEGLNRKLAINTPRGIYRGYRLATNASANFVTVEADPDTSDHSLVYQTSTGFSLTIRREGGDFNVDLSSLVDTVEKTWVLAVNATYALATTTAASIVAYELSPTDDFTTDPDFAELVVLGTVTISASSAAPIPASNIKEDRRTFAWQNEAPEATTWFQAVRNSGFEAGTSTGAAGTERHIPYWEAGRDGGNVLWTTVADATAPRGERSLNLNNTVTTAISSAYFRQKLGVPVVESKRIYLRYSYEILTAASSGSLAVALMFKDADGVDTTTLSTTIDITSTTSGYVTVEKTFAVASGDTLLDRVAITFSSATWGSTGNAVRFSEIEVHTEGGQVKDSIGAPVDAGHLILRDSISPTPNLQEGATLEYDSASGTLTLSTLDGGAVDVTLPDDLNVGADLDVGGNFTISGTETITGNLVVEGTSALKDVLTLGANQLATAADARDNERVGGELFAGSSNLTLIQEWQEGTSQALRLYVSGTGVPEWTINASWDGTNYVKDVTGQIATRFEVSPTFRVQYRAAGNDADWSTWDTEPLLVTESGSLVTATNLDVATDLTVGGATAVEGTSELKDTVDLGANNLGSSTEALTARVTSGAITGGDFTLLWESVPTSERGIRLYVFDDTLLITINSSYDGANWNKDVNGEEATRYEFTGTQLLFRGQDSATNSWADGSWETRTELSVENLTTALGMLRLGENALTANADLEIPRIVTTGKEGADLRTLLWEVPSTSATTPHVRFYSYGGDGGAENNLEISLNAFWDNTSQVWDEDPSTTLDSRKFSLNTQGLLIQKHTGSGTWNDDSTGWTEEVALRVPSNLVDSQLLLFGKDASNERAYIGEIVSSDGTNNDNIRIYNSLNSLEFTINAKWDETSDVWDADDNGRPAVALRVGTGGNDVGYRQLNGELFTGTGDSFSIPVSGTVELTDAGTLFSTALIGHKITITGATSAANNGTFIVSAVPSSTEIQFSNVSGVAESFSGTWTVETATLPSTWPDSDFRQIVSFEKRGLKIGEGADHFAPTTGVGGGLTTRKNQCRMWAVVDLATPDPILLNGYNVDGLPLYTGGGTTFRIDIKGNMGEPDYALSIFKHDPVQLGGFLFPEVTTQTNSRIEFILVDSSGSSATLGSGTSYGVVTITCIGV